MWRCKDKSCVMVLELASWSSESSPELLPESSPEEMRSTTTLLPESSLEESTLTSMHVERLLLCVEGKNPTSPWQVSLESANLALARVYGFLPRANEERTSSMEHRGRRTGAARWDGSSSSPRNLTLLGGGQTAPRKMDVDVATTTSLQNLPPRVAGHTCDGMRLRRGRGTRNPEKGIEGGRRGGAFIKKVWIRKWYDDSQPPVANEVAGLGIFEWRTICFSPFNLQSNFVSRISPSTVIQIWWYLFLNVSKSTYIHLWHFYVCNSISWMLFIHLILFHISTA
jgi:hypothetical protein